MRNVTGEGLFATLIAILIFLFFTFGFLFMYLDARNFYDACLAGGGFVSAPRVCTQ